MLLKDSMRRKRLLRIAKIAMGSFVAVIIAEALNIQNAASAGTIALLTIVTTKWETLRLSCFRLITYVFTVALAWISFAHIDVGWEAYGVFIFLLVLISEALNVEATISVNAVIGIHFLTSRNFTLEFVINELMIVIIGISIAIVLNLFHLNESHRKYLITNMRYTEKKLQEILTEFASYLMGKEMSEDVWKDIESLEEQIRGFQGEAFEYQENTFTTHTGYYMEYFEMRLKQCEILNNLHCETMKMRELPKQAKVVADYILYLKDYILEKNSPEAQMQRLADLFEEMHQAPLPATREEFEARAILYHVLMDIEEFVLYKSKFVENLDKNKLKKYWEVE
ncbi:MAG: hypothetical protein E7270_03745 [Lachnospiraceae bacterium]|nr:hypothetical protein [Lachnospiraceae bacterium]